MIYCNYCTRSVKQLDRKAGEEGWGRVKCDLTRTNYREGPESQEVRSTFIITHCPDHLQEAFDELMKRVAQAHADFCGISLKETFPASELVKTHDK